MCILSNLGRPTGPQHRSLLLAVVAAASWSLSQVQMAVADASISVDASSPVAQSASGNDLATLQNIFQGANIPAEPAMEPALTLLKPIITDLKMKRLRLLQSDNLCDLDSSNNLGSISVGTNPDGSYAFSPVVSGGCNLVAWTLPWVLNNGLSPHVAVASFMPPGFIPPVGAAENWDTNTLNRYKIYADRLVRYIVTKAFDVGAPSVIFEVSNELDIADSQPQVFDSANPSNNKLALLG